MSSVLHESLMALRKEIDGLLAAGQPVQARALLAELWRAEQSSAVAAFVSSRAEKLAASLKMTSCRLAILHSFTVDPLVSLAKAGAAVAGIQLTVHVGNFNTYAQEILLATSDLYAFNPDVVILAVQTRDISPQLWGQFADLSPQDVGAEVDRVLQTLCSLIEAFRSRSNAHLLIHNLELPAHFAWGIGEAQRQAGQSDAIRKINQGLLMAAQRHQGVYMLDYDALVARHGRQAWHDESRWLSTRLPFAAGSLAPMAREWVRMLHPLMGKVCKAVVVDLDNTLWGGVVGEDGKDGIKLGAEYPGAAFQQLQRALLDVHRRGILLAICSKNNPPEALDVLSSHPGMILRPEHFAAMRINWQDKAQNLREIASELNIGVDSLAFLDDNPVERQWVRSQLPEVTVLEPGENSMHFANNLREAGVLERLTLSQEDAQRGQYYNQQNKVNDLRERSSSLEDFYTSLQIGITVATVTSKTLPRVSQLTQKTNQFNLTTRRYSEQQIRQMATDGACRVYSLSATDIFGDNGLVGVAITRLQDGVSEIDTFLLSCRVIGRTIETALLSILAQQARAQGARKMVGWYIPTPKNSPASNLYGTHGFTRTGDENGSTRWELDLSSDSMKLPQWIHVQDVSIQEFR